MDHGATQPPLDETGRASQPRPDPVPSVTVRYWAAARAAAGCTSEKLVGSTVAEVLAAARRAHPDNPQFARVLGVSSLLVGERPVASHDLDDVPVVDGDVVEVLPPFAGG